MSPSVHQGGRGARQRLSRYRAHWDQQPILGGGGQNRRPDRGQDAARPPRRRGGGAGPDDRERQGHELPGETERVVQVRTRSKSEPEGRSEEALGGGESLRLAVSSGASRGGEFGSAGVSEAEFGGGLGSGRGL